MRPDNHYQDVQRQTLMSTMAPSEFVLDPNRLEGSFSGPEVVLDRDDDSSMTRHAQRSWDADRDGGMQNDHWAKKIGKKRAFCSTIWTEKNSINMDQAVWTISDPNGSLASGETSIIDAPKPNVDFVAQGAGESAANASKVVKEISKLVAEDNDNDGAFVELDKSGEKIVRSRSSSMCSSGSCAANGVFSREHVLSQSQLLLQYVDHLESLSWEEDQSDVLGVLVEMITAVNYHVSSVDEHVAGSDQEHGNLQAEIRQEKTQIKALAQELFRELADAELAHRLIAQLDQ